MQMRMNTQTQTQMHKPCCDDTVDTAPTDAPCTTKLLQVSHVVLMLDPAHNLVLSCFRTDAVPSQLRVACCNMSDCVCWKMRQQV